MKISVVFNEKNNDSLYIALEAAEILAKSGISVFMDCRHKNKVSNRSIEFLKDDESLIENCDILLVTGGDGTVIHYAKNAAFFRKPVLGINSGTVGFMTALEKNCLDELKKIADENYRIDKRMMIEISIDGLHRKFLALNDLALNRGICSQIVSYEVIKNNERVCRYRSDGIIISTPTGSTAYSLSAGGPVIESAVECMAITPVCPHSFVGRSLILSPDEPIEVRCKAQPGSEVFFSVDGLAEKTPPECEMILVKKSDLFALFVNLADNDFYKNIDQKLSGKFVI